MAPSVTSPTNGSPTSFTDFYNIINGQLTSTKETRHGINPATKKPLYPVPVSTKEDVDTAVNAAKEAFKTWSITPVEERRKRVLAYAERVKELQGEFTQLLTKEQGKPLMFATTEAQDGYNWLTTNANFDLPEEILEDTDERKVIHRYAPLGVVVGIVPWNFPIQLACGKISPALITGNCFIMKPSPFTPYCGLKLAEIAQQFFPPGVFQALSGDDNLGPWLTSHPGVDKISFTGSTATGKKVMESASKTLKRVTLELGGNDPAIICKNVNIQEVAPKITKLAFLNSGQICVALKRIFIHVDIYDEFRDAMVETTKNLLVGPGTQEGVFLGPIQNSMQYERVKGFFADIETNNLKIATGGPNASEEGYFITPTIIDSPPLHSRIVTEEPFGPILPLLSWTDENEVISLANDTKMGLGASVWSNDVDEAERIAKQLEAGTVWANTHFEVDPRFPFQGHKESGIGSEWGKGGLRAFCNVQTLIFKKTKI